MRMRAAPGWRTVPRCARRGSRRRCCLACTREASRRRAILVVGDSLSAEYGLPRGSGWVALLEQRLARRRRSRASVVNASISGDTTVRRALALARAAAAAQAARTWCIELGANDALRGLPLTMTQDNLLAMARAGKAAGARVLLVGMQMPPNYGRKYGEDFAALFAAVAQGRGRRAGAVPAAGRGRRAERGGAVPARPHPSDRGGPADASWTTSGRCCGRCCASRRGPRCADRGAAPLTSSGPALARLGRVTLRADALAVVSRRAAAAASAPCPRFGSGRASGGLCRRRRAAGRTAGATCRCRWRCAFGRGGTVQPARSWAAQAPRGAGSISVEDAPRRPRAAHAGVRATGLLLRHPRGGPLRIAGATRGAAGRRRRCGSGRWAPLRPRRQNDRRRHGGLGQRLRGRSRIAPVATAAGRRARRASVAWPRRWPAEEVFVGHSFGWGPTARLTPFRASRCCGCGGLRHGAAPRGVAFGDRRRHGLRLQARIAPHVVGARTGRPAEAPLPLGITGVGTAAPRRRAATASARRGPAAWASRRSGPAR